MSTRGCVAIKTEDGWRGVFNHWDSYPTGLGKELWHHLRRTREDECTYRCLECGKEFKGRLAIPVYHNKEITAIKCPYCRGKIARDLKEFAEKLLQYGDWREYLNKGVCEYCGKPKGQPCNISGRIFLPVKKTEEEIREYYEAMPWAKDNPEQVRQSIESDLEILHNIERTGYPDPEAKYHSHRGKESQITNLDPDPLFIIWVYVIDPEERTMTVLRSQSDKKTKGEIREEPILRDDGYWDYGHCAFRHVEVAKFSVDGPEPNWEKIEKTGR
jgi:DNA-directed RNA polymerase subunit RPC12/RpoP